MPGVEFVDGHPSLDLSSRVPVEDGLVILEPLNGGDKPLDFYTASLVPGSVCLNEWIVGLMDASF
jgi:hypothetical protein